MIECPNCGQLFKESVGVAYLDEVYCSSHCAEEATKEGRDLNEAVEPEEG